MLLTDQLIDHSRAPVRTVLLSPLTNEEVEAQRREPACCCVHSGQGQSQDEHAAGWPQSLCPRELVRLPPNGLFLIVLSVALLLMGARDGFRETETVKSS